MDGPVSRADSNSERLTQLEARGWSMFKRSRMVTSQRINNKAKLSETNAKMINFAEHYACIVFHVTQEEVEGKG